MPVAKDKVAAGEMSNVDIGETYRLTNRFA
jgi:hypothetical protein